MRLLHRHRARADQHAPEPPRRFDAGPWIERLRWLPSAVIVTTRERSVPPAKQRKLAEKLDARVIEVDGDHLVAATHPERFRPALLEALRGVRAEPG